MADTYATESDMMRAHLRSGPESDRLEFTEAYYQQIIDSPGSRLIEALRSDPNAPGLLAPEHAIGDAICILRPELDGHDYSGRYKNVERVFRGAAWLGIQSYQLSPEAGVDSLAMDSSGLASASELTEVARLSVQYYRVMTSLAETGEVPAL